MTDKTRNRIAFWIGIAGGGIFQILNAVTNGEIPGGGRGGVIGLIVFGGPAWLILYLIQRRQRHSAQQSGPGDNKQRADAPFLAPDLRRSTTQNQQPRQQQ
jgi:hypothetical protein